MRGWSVVAECRSRRMRFVTVRHRASNTLAAYLEVKMMNDPDDNSLVLYMWSLLRFVSAVILFKWVSPSKTADSVVF